MKGLSKLQKRILMQALTPSKQAVEWFANMRMDFISEDAWPDHQPSASERASLSRALRRLEDRGLLDRAYGGLCRPGNAPAFTLTDYGRIVATNLSASASAT
jgi:hypothetical protein